MTEASIPVDLLNPGQVFACIGFLEAADLLLGGAMGVFDWSEEETRFHLRARGEENPFACVLRFLDRAEARAVAVGKLVDVVGILVARIRRREEDGIPPLHRHQEFPSHERHRPLRIQPPLRLRFQRYHLKSPP